LSLKLKVLQEAGEWAIPGWGKQRAIWKVTKDTNEYASLKE
jgi:hypothetical protein